MVGVPVEASHLIKYAVDEMGRYGSRSLPVLFEVYKTAAEDVARHLVKQAFSANALRTVGRGALFAAGAAPIAYFTGRAISRKAKQDAEEAADHAISSAGRAAAKGLAAAGLAYLGYKGIQRGIQGGATINQGDEQPGQYSGSWRGYGRVKTSSLDEVSPSALDKVAFLCASVKFFDDFCGNGLLDDPDAVEAVVEKTASLLGTRMMLEEAMNSTRMPREELIKAAAMYSLNTIDLFSTLKDFYDASV